MVNQYFPVHTDYSKGFGGKYGVQKEAMDKAAVGWDHQEKVAMHESQKGKRIFLLQVKPFISEFLGLTLPSLSLNMSTDANKGYSLKLKTEDIVDPH